MKLSNGELLVKERKVTGFSDDEEKAAGLDKHMPYMLETELIKLGANYIKGGLWGSHVVVDGRLITGQNSGSTRDVGKALLAYKW
jgi:putative intracellular protease/amidase